MKSLTGYIVLVICFFGLLFVKHELDKFNSVDMFSLQRRKSDLSQRQMKERISSIENEVDSLRYLLNKKNEEPVTPVLPKLPEAPKVMLSPESFKLDVDLSEPEVLPKKAKKKLGWRWRSEYNTINDAVKVRNSGNEFSEMAQQQINAAYELGGNDWYGAEKAWNSEAFKKRVIEIRNKSK